MNYTGKKVHHSKFGYGSVIFEEESGLIHVQFESQTMPKQFFAPGCFNSFLSLLDSDDESKREIKRPDTEERIRRDEEERDRIRKINERKLRENAEIKHYSSPEEFRNKAVSNLISEINYLRETGGRRQKLNDGRFVKTTGMQYIYSFDAETELSLPNDTRLSVFLGNDNDSVPATVVDCEDFTVIISIGRYLGTEVPRIEFTSETWRLLDSLIDRVTEVCENPTQIVRDLICEGNKKANPNRKIVSGQDNALELSRNNAITFIWGPPGTGKTETLARIALDQITRGKRVLMLSYSNVSVDGAVMRVFEKDSSKTPGKIVRYGYPKSQNISQHEYLPAYNLVLQQHKQLSEERNRLVEERKHTSRESPRYVDIGKRLAEIRKELQEEERKTVSNARFVATTITKAAVDSAVYKERFDAVIFDEASMAYIPQIVFAAGLATERFICMGDFAQLPPIVQSDCKGLQEDIFKFCGITQAVESGFSHDWLCMLDTQYRMHPEIADFASRTMYRGLLKSAPGTEEKRAAITDDGPFPGQAIALVDLSGMLSVCTKTADQSRINILSGIVSLLFAIRIANRHDVGIITPYNAQSKLLHALSRDIEEQKLAIHKITCATVHQFQGSEQDVILYDAVDCYRMPFPGMLLTSTENNYANRLYNVALTRAKGKMINIANATYLKKKKLSDMLIFRNMLNEQFRSSTILAREGIRREREDCAILPYRPEEGNRDFLEDIKNARKEIRIDIPGAVSSDRAWIDRLSAMIGSAKSKGVKVAVRVERKSTIPESLQLYAVENRFVTDPIAVIDKTVVWYGEPLSDANFKAEGKIIPTLYRPVFRIEGKHFAKAIYGQLGMGRTVSQANSTDNSKKADYYDSFSDFVEGEIKCPACGRKMRLRESGEGHFFLACIGTQRCRYTCKIDENTLKKYLNFESKEGMFCPKDNMRLLAKQENNELFVECCGTNHHRYKLDEI